LKKFKEVKIQRYEQLLEPAFWTQKGVWSGATSDDSNEGLTKEEREFQLKGTAAGGKKVQ